jgi:hypothetical protein
MENEKEASEYAESAGTDSADVLVVVSPTKILARDYN